MLRVGATFFLLLWSVVCAQAAAAAAADCRFCLDSVVVQTRDGQAWAAGQPVTLVVRVADTVDSALPAAAQVVVMQTDGDRTKCLGIPLKLVQSDASGGLYAGLFFPFHAAHYDGVLVVGSDVQSVAFDVSHMAAGAAPIGELPAAEPLATSAPPLISLPDRQTSALAAGVMAMCSVLAFVVCRRRWHTGPNPVS